MEELLHWEQQGISKESLINWGAAATPHAQSRITRQHLFCKDTAGDSSALWKLHPTAGSDPPTTFMLMNGPTVSTPVMPQSISSKGCGWEEAAGMSFAMQKTSRLKGSQEIVTVHANPHQPWAEIGCSHYFAHKAAPQKHIPKILPCSSREIWLHCACAGGFAHPGKQHQCHTKAHGRARALTWCLELITDESEQLTENVAVGHGPGEEAVVDAGSFQEQLGVWWDVGSLQGWGGVVRKGARSWCWSSA